MAADPDRLDYAVRRWLRMPGALGGSPAVAIAQRCKKGHRLDVWNHSAILQIYRANKREKREAPREAIEMIINDPTPITASDGKMIMAKSGDRMIYVPVERIAYPYSLTFPNGEEIVVNAPSP